MINRKLKRYLGTVLSVCMILNANCIVNAADNNGLKDLKIDELVAHGYTIDTAEALSEKDLDEVYQSICNGKTVNVYTCAMEVDNLEEIENYLSCTQKELIDMGLTEKEIAEADEQIEEIVSSSDQQLEQKYKMSKAQIKMLRKSVENGIHNKNIKKKDIKKKDIKNKVSASGSITSSEMTYTQSIIDNSTYTKPNYSVKLSYTWKSVYALAPFTDEIVAAWGGGLNSKNHTGTAKYYTWSTIGGNFNTCKNQKTMSSTLTPNAGVEFKFPQSNGGGIIDNAYKTKTGSASFTLYQTKRDGKETNLISNYCHRVISVGGAGISISASGPSVSLSIGTAWDKTSQKKTVIGY